MRHDDDAWLLDMHQAAMKARAFVQGLADVYGRYTGGPES